MLIVRLSALSIALMLALAAPPASAEANKPAALVLDVAGDSEPAIEPFGELAAGTSVKLAAGTSVTFLHYFTCQEVTVQGGDLVLSEQRYTLRGGKVVGVERARCPKTVVLAESRQIGGVLVRSGDDKKLDKLPRRPDFVLAGARRADVASVRVRDGDAVVMQAPMTGRRFSWPAAAPELAEKAGYVLEMLDAAGAVVKSVEFEAAVVAGRDRIMVFRFD